MLNAFFTFIIHSQRNRRILISAMSSEDIDEKNRRI